MRDGMRGFVAGLLALLLVLAPAPLLADGVDPPETGGFSWGHLVRYTACAGGIVLAATGGGIFAAAIACGLAFTDCSC